MNKFKAFFNNLLKKDTTKTIVTSLWCALIGLILGFIILLIFNFKDAPYGMVSILGNFLVFQDSTDRWHYFGQTLAKTAPLIAISLSFGEKSRQYIEPA